MRLGNLTEERDERENQDRPEIRGQEKETVLENRKSAQVTLSSLSGPRALLPGLGGKGSGKRKRRSTLPRLSGVTPPLCLVNPSPAGLQSLGAELGPQHRPAPVQLK